MRDFTPPNFVNKTAPGAARRDHGYVCSWVSLKQPWAECTYVWGGGVRNGYRIIILAMFYSCTANAATRDNSSAVEVFTLFDCIQHKCPSSPHTVENQSADYVAGWNLSLYKVPTYGLGVQCTLDGLGAVATFQGVASVPEV